MTARQESFMQKASANVILFLKPSPEVELEGGKLK